MSAPGQRGELEHVGGRPADVIRDVIGHHGERPGEALYRLLVVLFRNNNQRSPALQ